VGPPTSIQVCQLVPRDRRDPVSALTAACIQPKAGQAREQLEPNLLALVVSILSARPMAPNEAIDQVAVQLNDPGPLFSGDWLRFCARSWFPERVIGALHRFPVVKLVSECLEAGWLDLLQHPHSPWPKKPSPPPWINRGAGAPPARRRKRLPRTHGAQSLTESPM
jgi:hypothetical protein